MVKLRASIPLLVSLLAALLLSGCSLLAKDPPGVGSLTLTDKVQEGSMAPVSQLDAFTSAHKVIYATVLVQNPRKGTQVTARWTFDREGSGTFIAVDESSVTFPQDSTENYVAFSLKAVSAFLPGTYKVEVLLDGKPVREQTFKVTGA
ncbi:MAG TPA: hypothetical protein VNT75_04750 [Symbiobacteriaceae bacterium]|nr:hypothetical protein [Symbiobacteriaceae bacterium]